MIKTEQLDPNFKIKDRDDKYNANFASIINYASLSTWIHIESDEHWVGHTNLGYQNASTILKSVGGTLLTDILTGNKYILSQFELDDNYYTKIDEIKYYELDDKNNRIEEFYE